mmetsp:Transcript_7921/g.26197  ORF Transcript_7921/g.26197 Transcript_7921/m.26197 type:complete len:442 (+) Transcript_7921:36-1361(+)
MAFSLTLAVRWIYEFRGWWRGGERRRRRRAARVDKRARRALKRATHLIRAFILVIIVAIVVNSRRFILLIFTDKIVHVAFGFGEFHLIHTLASVPVQESLATEHRRKRFRHALEHFLNSRGVTDKSGGHLETLGRDVAHGRLDVVRDPFHEVARVFVLHVQKLLVNLLGGHATAVERRGGEVAAVTRISGAHHVLRIPHLRGNFRHGKRAVLLSATGRQRRKANHEEMQARERHQVHRELSQIGVQLTRETQAARNPGHNGRNQVVQVTKRGVGQLQRAEANIIKRFVVEHDALVGVFDQLVHGQRGVVRLDDSVGHLGRRYDREREHHAVGVFFANLGNQKRTHTGTSTASEGVAHLEALQAVARLRLLAHDVQHAVDELGAFRVVALGPVVTGASLSKHKVIGAEDLTVRSRTHGIHRARFKVHEHRARHVATCEMRQN